MPGAISARDAKRLAHAPGELAFLDLREHGQYGEGHPFLAVPCPFSRLEHAVVELVPRRTVRVLLLDAGDGVATRAASRLTALGYDDISWVEGGAAAWAEAGLTLFKGVNLPSKTLGELLEASWHVPHIDVDTLDRWQRDGKPFHLFDGRPQPEFAKSTIPGARSIPNGELPYRLGAAIPQQVQPIVVHCAGRTRSIVGAAGLALAGVADVVALENGTQGWALSGRHLAWNNAPEPLPAIDSRHRQAGTSRAVEIARRYAIPMIHAPACAALLRDAGRTAYLLDVRTLEEFTAGTYDGARHAPGVQLVQATDQWVGVRRARLVLTCDNGLRSAIAAVFLSALGYEVFILPGAATAGGVGLRAEAPEVKLPQVNAAQALQSLDAGGALLDLRGSMAFRAGHLPGARWAIRPRLPADLDPATSVHLIGADVEISLVAQDLAARGFARLGRVSADTGAWQRDGVRPVQSPADPPDAEAIDFLFFVHDRHDGNMESARRYLEWETGLLAQLDTQERAEFSIGPSPF